MLQVKGGYSMSKGEKVIEFDDFVVYASNRGVDLHTISDFYIYYENLNSLKRNFKKLKVFIRGN